MSRFSITRIPVLPIVALFAANSRAPAGEPRTSDKGHYLLVWAGDRAKVGNDSRSD
jgi:hypothetical protein